MTAAVETQQNGRVRKTLSSQLDRLDGILDGLADALNESVAAAVEKAVGNVIAEILTNPAFTERLRAPVTPTAVVSDETTDATSPPSQPRPGVFSRAMGAVRAGCGHLQVAGRAVLRRAATVADAGCSYIARLLFRGRVLAGIGVLVAVGVVALLAVPRIPLLLTAAAGWLAALVARARTSLRPAPLTCDLNTQ
jgi:hypothetical protein